ncbi:MAG TPA: hypothetical protein VFX61_15985 [Micromonosporaceae bacterium]|nr:hypothetical protein [Micromonosporaceae bacterium]
MIVTKGEDEMHVRLEKEWTDAAGKTYAAGDTVDVDAATLAELQASGIVSEANWAGPTGGADAGTNWAGPTGTQP